MDRLLPYVISGTLDSARSELISTKQIDQFRESLDADLQAMGKKTLWVPESELRQGMRAFCKSTELPVVSLDNRYVDPEWADSFIGITRAVDTHLQDAGYDSRAGSDALQAQLDNIGAKYAGKEIALVDDVLFSGEMVAWLISELTKRGTKVSALYAGIAIREGVEKLTELGIDISCGRLFPDVDDELVEIDFTALPGSGRKVKGKNKSALYFDNRFGQPNRWMSIPDDMVWKFCVSSLERNLQLLRQDAQLAPFMGYPRGEVGMVLRERLEQELKGGQNA